MHWLERHWSRLTPVSLLLAPLAGLYCFAVGLRRAAYRYGLFKSACLPVPVIVVGNLTVGGTGKTPFVIWLARFLAAHGRRPGIVTRGYGGRARDWPQRVRADSDPRLVGDEPVLIARQAGCPVYADPDRVRAARALIAAEEGCDVLIADDGLQHYRLARQIEIALADGARGYGNGLCLPAGPLREPVSRLHAVDVALVLSGPAAGEGGANTFRLAPRGFRRLDGAAEAEAAAFRGRRVHAVAGIGHPARFFAALRALGLEIIEHPFPDHHPYTAADLDFGDDLDIIMTEKDAVKCERLGLGTRAWSLAVEVEPASGLGDRLLELLEEKTRGG
jgi:tetraacyldisaccharide 4'-kinase